MSDENHFDHNSNLPTGNIEFLKHPDEIIPDKEADYYFMNIEFKLEEKRAKLEKDKLPRRRIKRWFSSLFNKSENQWE